MSTNKTILILLASLVAVLAGAVVYSTYTTPKVGVIRIKDIFENFDMKKEVQKKYDKELNAVQKRLDSVAFELTEESKKIESGTIKDKEIIQRHMTARKEYYDRMKKFDDDKKSLTNDYNNQILNRMQEYIKKYSAEHGYDYVMGDDNNGALLYNNKKYDITDAVTAYINKSYAGKN